MGAEMLACHFDFVGHRRFVNIPNLVFIEILWRADAIAVEPKTLFG